MPRKKAQSKPAAPAPVPSFAQGWRGLGGLQSPPVVSAQWLAIALCLAMAAAAACAWGSLCLLFWQGSWQLLYHPASGVTRTPASAGVPFDPVGFATTEAGQPRLKGWWIPAAPDARYGRYTVLYLHGQSGNLGDEVDEVAALHSAGVNVLAFDFRGYGQSQFIHPSEAHSREDAESAIEYLTNTRHVPAGSLVLFGRGLGANLALEVAAAHPELAGVALDEPLSAPLDAIFSDPRAMLVPARLLVRDRWELNAPAAGLRIPSLWFYRTSAPGPAQQEIEDAYRQVAAHKEQVWLGGPPESAKNFHLSLTRWLDGLPAKPAMQPPSR